MARRFNHATKANEEVNDLDLELVAFYGADDTDNADLLGSNGVLRDTNITQCLQNELEHFASFFIPNSANPSHSPSVMLG